MVGSPNRRVVVESMIAYGNGSLFIFKMSKMSKFSADIFETDDLLRREYVFQQYSLLLAYELSSPKAL